MCIYSGAQSGSYDKSTFHFVRNYHTVFESGWRILHPHQQWMKFLFLHIFGIFDIFGVVSVLGFGHSIKCLVVPFCFNFHFLLTYDVEYISICLFAIYVPSLVWWLLKFWVHLLIWLFIFLLLSCKSSLYILDDSSSSHVSFANIFSLSVACLFIHLTMPSMKQKFLILISSAYQFFFSWIMFLVSNLKVHHQTQGHLGFVYVIF